MGSTYGEWLKSQREAAGMTQQKLANAALMTRTHIAHIEADRRIPSEDDAQRLDRALNTGDVLTSFLPRKDVVVADRFESARILEQQAVTIHEFALTLIPGILQTERYMRSVLATAQPRWSQERCDQIVVTRLERAKILDDPLTPVVWVLLDEAVLRRAVGGREVMAEQVSRIVRLVENSRIRVHVLPFGLGAHTLQQSMLTLMWFEDQPPVAYSEALYMARIYDAPAVVERIRTAYDLALSDSLPLKESLALLRATAKDYGHHE